MICTGSMFEPAGFDSSAFVGAKKFAIRQRRGATIPKGGGRTHHAVNVRRIQRVICRTMAWLCVGDAHFGHAD